MRLVVPFSTDRAARIGSFLAVTFTPLANACVAVWIVDVID
jgi:hypothetical protein